MRNINLKKFFLYLLITSVCVSALIGIVVILIGTRGDFEERVLLTTLTITITSILGLACGAYLETQRGKILPMSGIVFAVMAAALWMVIIWWKTDEPVEWFVKITATATLLAAACSHISLLSLARLEKKFIWSYYAVHVVIWGLTAVLLFLIWNKREINEEVIGRVVGVLSILVGSLTVITPIFHKLSHQEPVVNEIDAEIDKLRARIAELEEQKSQMDTTPPD